MFAEYALYYQGKTFALVCDNSLFIKVTSPGESLAHREGRILRRRKAGLQYQQGETG